MIAKEQKIIIDTNALMAISELGIDLFSAIADACVFKYKLCILSGTLLELEKIRDTQRGAFRDGAKLALQIVARYVASGTLCVLASSDDVDNELVVHSQQGHLVLSQDIALKKRLVRPYLTIRQRKMVILVE